VFRDEATGRDRAREWKVAAERRMFTRKTTEKIQAINSNFALNLVQENHF
jgi:hypothetical protein